MVPTDIIEFAKCLSSETRFYLIQLLAVKELCVCELETLTGLNQANISQHLRVLFNAGLVEKKRDGQLIYYSLNKNVFMDQLKNLNTLILAASQCLDETMINKIENLSCDENIKKCKNSGREL